MALKELKVARVQSPTNGIQCILSRESSAPNIKGSQRWVGERMRGVRWGGGRIAMCRVTRVTCSVIICCCNLNHTNSLNLKYKLKGRKRLLLIDYLKLSLPYFFSYKMELFPSKTITKIVLEDGSRSFFGIV